MTNYEPFDEDRVFEKLEREASRHSSRSSSKGRSSSLKLSVSGKKPVTEEEIDSGGSSKTISASIRDAEKKNLEKESASGIVEDQNAFTEKKPDKVLTEEELSQEIREAVEKEGESFHTSRKAGHKHHSSHRHHRKKQARDRHAPRKKGWIRTVAAVLALILLIGGAGTGFLFSKLNKITRTDGMGDVVDTNEEFDQENPYGLKPYSSKLITSEDVTNILLIGQDRRKGDKAEMRSDAMIVCSINKKTKEITLTSLMRDMYLPVPGKGYGMINATYLAGGFELLNQTIEKNFGIRIDGNVEVDFERFISLMDLVGPIELNLSAEEAEHLNESGYSLKEGMNTMDSEQVLAYCRMRKNIGGDWGRTDRQRKVIARIYQKLRAQNLGTIYRFIDEALPLFSTDLSNGNIIRLASSMVTNRIRIKHSYRLPEEGTYTQEIREETLHVLIPDIRENCKLIQEYIYGYLID